MIDLYNPKSSKAEEFINHEEILESLEYAKANKDNKELIKEILDKANKAKAAAYRSRHAAAAPLLLNARRENRYRLPEQTAHAHHHTITAFCGFHSDSTSFPC